MEFFRGCFLSPFLPTIFTTVPFCCSNPKVVTRQMKERCDKSLCYNCDEKWNPAHKCKPPKLISCMVVMLSNRLRGISDKNCLSCFLSK